MMRRVQQRATVDIEHRNQVLETSKILWMVVDIALDKHKVNFLLYLYEIGLQIVAEMTTGPRIERDAYHCQAFFVSGGAPTTVLLRYPI